MTPRVGLYAHAGNVEMAGVWALREGRDRSAYDHLKKAAGLYRRLCDDNGVARCETMAARAWRYVSGENVGE